MLKYYKEHVFMIANGMENINKNSKLIISDIIKESGDNVIEQIICAVETCSHETNSPLQ